MARVLYISYDGVLEPLGQSQVLAYLRQLSLTHTIHLISFEKPADLSATDVRAYAEELKTAGIAWHQLTYHKRPSALATAWDIVAGTSVGMWVVLRHRVCIVHARSYVASVMALAIKRMTGAKYIFDMRGFWADERVDGGIWPKGSRIYRVAKWFERRFLLGADHVISLTHAAVEEMRRFPYLASRAPLITVIPTCADLNRFKPTAAGADTFVVGYVGSAGTWYLFDQAVFCFSLILEMRPGARILIVNKGEHPFIRERLDRGGIPSSAVDLVTATHSEIPALMARMNAAVFFIKPVFSKQASAPTKLAEFLGCGVPCLGNTGVGDMALVLESQQVGVTVDRFDEQTLRTGVSRLLALVGEPETRQRCVETAERHFSLTEGVRRYRGIYEQLSGESQ